MEVYVRSQFVCRDRVKNSLLILSEFKGPNWLLFFLDDFMGSRSQLVPVISLNIRRELWIQSLREITEQGGTRLNSCKTKVQSFKNQLSDILANQVRGFYMMLIFAFLFSECSKSNISNRRTNYWERKDQRRTWVKSGFLWYICWRWSQEGWFWNYRKAPECSNKSQSFEQLKESNYCNFCVNFVWIIELIHNSFHNLYNF